MTYLNIFRHINNIKNYMFNMIVFLKELVIQHCIFPTQLGYCCKTLGVKNPKVNMHRKAH